MAGGRDGVLMANGIVPEPVKDQEIREVHEAQRQQDDTELATQKLKHFRTWMRSRWVFRNRAMNPRFTR